MSYQIKFQLIEHLESADHMKCMDCVMAGRDDDQECLKIAGANPRNFQPLRPTYFLRGGTGFINARPLCAWCANRNAVCALLMNGAVEFNGALMELPLPFPELPAAPPADLAQPKQEQLTL